MLTMVYNHLSMVACTTKTKYKKQRITYSIDKDRFSNKISIILTNYHMIKCNQLGNIIYKETYNQPKGIIPSVEAHISQSAKYKKNNIIEYKDNHGNIWNHNMKFPLPYECKSIQEY